MKDRTFVLDSSVALSWCFGDEQTDDTRMLLKAVGDEEWLPVVPPLWSYEMVNVLLGAVRRNRISEAQMRSFISDLLKLPLHLMPASLPDIFQHVEPLAMQHQLTAYDVAYLELALSEGIPLATKDAALTKAAQSAGVPLMNAALLRKK